MQFLTCPDLPLRKKLLVKVIQKKGHAVPSHLAALVMKVKVVVLDFRIIEELNMLLESNAHGAFVSAFVDKIDNQLRSIEGLLRLKVLTERIFLTCWVWRTGENA